MTFFVGQKVEYINASRNPAKCFGYGDETCPVERGIYTIRAIISHHSISPDVAFLLNEIVNRPRSYVHGVKEMAFNSRRFRPLVERKTNISVFTQLLHSSPAPVSPDLVEAS